MQAKKMVAIGVLDGALNRFGFALEAECLVIFAIIKLTASLHCHNRSSRTN